MPRIILLFLLKEINVPHIGKPLIKDLVPSIGSMHHSYSLSVIKLCSSPIIEWFEYFLMIKLLIHFWIAKSAIVTGSNFELDFEC